MKKKRLITSALPYVNNIPHLGNLIQVLSADVFARFCRSRGYETLYVCGTDEYGTATETRALQEGITPKELCDRFFAIHRDIYDWFEISFDKFGRTSTPEQTAVVQDIFTKVDQAGYINEKEIHQLYCTTCDSFLADRFVHGVCPHCGYEEARGDQCEHCGKLLDPEELIQPRCGVCGNTPELRATKHLYIDLPGILPLLERWMDRASVEGFWARNAVQMTKSWIRDGLKERCITRDLKWGIPVPKKGYEDKVFYVWFDAPIGYISITATLTDAWEEWWKNPDEVELFQFIGKDNIPFHTVIFPSSLLATGENWTLLHHMSSTEYLNYETGKFSKSKGIGVFGTDAQDTGIPADVWRFYMYYNRPEKSDAVFTWKDFQEKVNGELIGNLGNLVNRTLSFISRFYAGKIPEAACDEEACSTIFSQEKKITEHLERAELRDALRTIFSLSSCGNRLFQNGEPWKTRKTDPEKAGALLKTLAYLIRDLAVMIEPYLPATSRKILSFYGIDASDWSCLGSFSGVSRVEKAEILFHRLEDEHIENLQKTYSGRQQTDSGDNADTEHMKTETEAPKEKTMDSKNHDAEKQFTETIDLRTAKIIDVQRHPKADKLYIEKISFGKRKLSSAENSSQDDAQNENEEEIRQIVSGLVPYYEAEELLGHTIIVVYNLKTAKLRGEKSQGMLLAAEASQENQEPLIEVLFADDVQPGTRVVLEEAAAQEAGKQEAETALQTLSADEFFSIPIRVQNHEVYVGSKRLAADGKPLRTKTVANGEVG